MGKSKIEWTEKSWNPISGCTKCSPGCDHCYAEHMSHRLAGRVGYPVDEPFRVTLHPERLDEPLRWRKPSRIFVCSMGDLFHDAVPDEYLCRVWNVMRKSCLYRDWTRPPAGAHTYLVLTKRPERMRDFCQRVRFDGSGEGRVYLADRADDNSGYRLMQSDPNAGLPNVWLGVTAEDQERADERIPLLLDTPTAVRFVSCEPLLGAIDLTRIRMADQMGVRSPDVVNVLTGDAVTEDGCGSDLQYPYLSWVIAGGETGPWARPMHPGWVHEIRDQCKVTGVPFFFKSFGEFQPFVDPQRFTRGGAETAANAHCWLAHDGTQGACWIIDDDGDWSNWTGDPPMKPGDDNGNISDEVAILSRVGKTRAGHLLDGVEHREVP